jgi:hypothetical protein
MLQCAETLQGYPHDARPLSLGCGVALYEMFNRKHQEQADDYMRKLYTGEELTRSDPEYLLRAAFIMNSERMAKYPLAIRMRMAIKGWNWRRRNQGAATNGTIRIRPEEDQKIRIY